jgi:hypothetical protein
MKKIGSHEEIQVGLVFAMYEIIEKFLNDIINDKWMSQKSKLCIIGGIMINCEGVSNDMFLPIKFEIQ